jgi:hypothetical protein
MTTTQPALASDLPTHLLIDRALDHAVARAVMGWELREIAIEPSAELLLDYVWFDADGDVASNDWEWMPSTEIAAAWQVLAALPDWEPTLSRGGAAADGVWTVRLARPGEVVSASAELAAEAICSAALSARRCERR